MTKLCSSRDTRTLVIILCPRFWLKVEHSIETLKGTQFCDITFISSNVTYYFCNFIMGLRIFVLFKM